MSLRCGCPDDAVLYLDGGFRDEIVFGPCQKCNPEPEEPRYHHILGPDELEG